MMDKRRRLPIGGVQAFDELRKGYDVYVDKTMHVYEMASRYNTVFLSRPRRFGKSLLCSTIKSLFRNERELFDDLAISKTDWEWGAYPVLHLDLSVGNFTESDGLSVLKARLNHCLEQCAREYGIDANFGEHASLNFELLTAELSRKIGKAVIIIDEYDAPLLNTIDQPELNKRLREELKGFYSVIKQNGHCIRFAFITGITKFAQVSMFSGMNHVVDISMRPEYSDICGITQEELEEYFAPEIDAYAPKHGGREKYIERLKGYYNGYYFTEESISVYNTYGILSHFDGFAKFEPSWSMSGAPSFLLKYLEMKTVDIVNIEDATMQATNFANYRDNTITLFPLLYQAGYLTISGYDETTGIYKLNYPNIEIRQALAIFLSNVYSTAQNVLDESPSTQLIDALLRGDFNKFMTVLKWYLSAVDYSLSSKITEYYVEFAVSNVINMLGLVCKNEAHTANGRMDSVIFAGDYVYVFEFKVDKPIENAIRQIKEKDYGATFASSGKKLVRVGVVFSREERNIVRWETVSPPPP